MLVLGHESIDGIAMLVHRSRQTVLALNHNAIPACTMDEDTTRSSKGSAAQFLMK